MLGSLYDSPEVILMTALPVSALSLVLGMLALSDVDVRYIYKKIKKPWFSPPASLFGPVWTVLHLLAAFAFWLVRIADPALSIDSGYTKACVALYSVFMYSLPLWSLCFFNKQMVGLSFLVILCNSALGVATTVLFYLEGGVVPMALMIPTCAWCAFATVLNAWILYHNKSVSIKSHSSNRRHAGYVMIPRDAHLGDF